MRYERSLAVAKRLADMLNLIQTGTYSSTALAKQLGISEQTVYRDILWLKQHGHDIRAARQGSRWAYELAASDRLGIAVPRR